MSRCPELGVASYGLTAEKARTALVEAVELYLSNAKRLGLLRDLEPILIDQTRYTTPLDISVG